MKKSHEEKSWREAMIEKHDRKLWRKVMKKSHEEESWRKAMIEKHEDYLIESHDRES